MTEAGTELTKCRFCGKEVMRLGAHIANLHPRILEQLEEFGDLEPQKSTPQAVFSQPQGVKKSTSDLVREKLDLMFDIKILEMLAASKDATLQDLQKALQPAQPQASGMDKLREIREYAAIMNEIRGVGEATTEGSDGWLTLANNALPMIKEMLPKRQQEVKQNVREGNTGSQRLIKRIQSEAPGSAGKPANPERQHQLNSGAEQQDSSNIGAVN